MSKQRKEDIRRVTFGKFDNEEDAYETQEHSDKEKPKVHQNKKPALAQKLKDTFVKKQEEEVPELWTGQTSVLDIIAPSSVDNGSRDYIVVDGVYHSYLYVAGYGYRTRNEAAWLSPLVEAGENIGISFTFRKLPREKILSRISQKTMLNRSRMRDVGDTRQDFEELDDAISSGYFLKEGMNRAAQDFYYMSTVIEVTASDEEELEQRVADVMTLCSSMSMVVKRADFKHEQCFLSTLPVLAVEPDIERKARRNILTDSLAASFPFSSFEIYDEGGIFLGLNKYNRSVAILDIFNSDKYNNANGCIFGTTGAGKTFLLLSMALRYRMQGIQVVIIAPEKGHEYIDACEAVGGKYIKFAPGSKDCVNLMEIRKTTLSPDREIKKDTREDSVVAERIQNILVGFKLSDDISINDMNLLDGAFIRTYEKFGITLDNKSLVDEKGKFKKMPTFSDLKEELLSKEETKKLAPMLDKFVSGSYSSFGKETNVDLRNKFIVLDISGIPEGMKEFAYQFCSIITNDITTSSRVEMKVVFLDEGWVMYRNKMSAAYVESMFRLIRAYGGGIIMATQDLSGFFNASTGDVGKEILNLSSFKIILHLEEDEAFTMQKYLSLSDEETMQIIRSGRGEALLCANKNKVCIDIKASPLMYDLITTKRTDLEKRKRNV